MNYELMAKILAEKSNSKFTADLIKKLKVSEAFDLIFHLDDPLFLRKIAIELEQEIGSGTDTKIVLLKHRGLSPQGSNGNEDKTISMEEYCEESAKTVKAIRGFIKERLEQIQ